MNLIAIQKELLKPGNRRAYEIYNDKIYFTPDGYMGYIVETKEFLLEPKKVFDRDAQDVLKKIADAEYFEARKTIMVYNGKYMLQKIRNGEGHAWIDIRKLKHFNRDCTFGMQKEGNLTPIAVYEDGIMVGFILPARVSESQEKEWK